MSKYYLRGPSLPTTVPNWDTLFSYCPFLHVETPRRQKRSPSDILPRETDHRRHRIASFSSGIFPLGPPSSRASQQSLGTGTRTRRCRSIPSLSRPLLARFGACLPAHRNTQSPPVPPPPSDVPFRLPVTRRTARPLGQYKSTCRQGHNACQNQSS
jgi:hypothetical protein